MPIFLNTVSKKWYVFNVFFSETFSEDFLLLKNSYNSCDSSISENTQTRQTLVVYSHFEQTVWRKTFKGAEQGKFCI